MRNILVVVDMQNDFIDGALGTPEAVAIVDNVVEKIKSYPTENIVATRDTHTPDYLNTQEGRNLPVVHCVEGTPGWEIAPKIAEALGDARVINKPTFGSVELAQLLVEWSREEELTIELVGLCTDICVVSNALLIKASLPETLVYVDESCCAGVTPATHTAAIQTMAMCQITGK